MQCCGVFSLRLRQTNRDNVSWCNLWWSCSLSSLTETSRVYWEFTATLVTVSAIITTFVSKTQTQMFIQMVMNFISNYFVTGINVMDFMQMITLFTLLNKYLMSSFYCMSLHCLPNRLVCVNKFKLASIYSISSSPIMVTKHCLALACFKKTTRLKQTVKKRSKMKAGCVWLNCQLSLSLIFKFSKLF